MTTTTLDRPEGRVLVLRGSPDRATAAIAEAVADELAAAGLPVDLRVPARVGGLAGYRAVVVGGRARFGHRHPSVVRFLRRHAAVLSVRPLWLFTVGPDGADAPSDAVFPDADPSGPRRWARELLPDLVRAPAVRA